VDLTLARATALAVLALAVSAPGAAAGPTGAGFDLRAGRAKPSTVYFDGERTATARFVFDARRRVDLVVHVIRVRDGEPVRRYLRRGLAPGRAHEVRWDGRRSTGRVPADGVYAFRVGPPGHRGAAVGRFDYHDHVFPVHGAHTYGDPFGAPRSGGRVHEGQDLPAACGTPLLAARGGRVAATGYSDALYGYWVLIDGLATRRDYFYSHLQGSSPLRAWDAFS
jgi:murein DD-endopeptidase MepM/ murein hydrolase activator NlpD